MPCRGRRKSCVLLMKGKEFLSASLCWVLLAAQGKLLVPPGSIESVIKAVPSVFACVPGVPGNWQGGGGRKGKKKKKKKENLPSCAHFYWQEYTHIFEYMSQFIFLRTHIRVSPFPFCSASFFLPSCLVCPHVHTQPGTHRFLAEVSNGKEDCKWLD